MIDNIETILPLLEFPEGGSYYVLTLMRRRKDYGNERMKRGVSTVTVKTISSQEQLLDRYEEYKRIADVTNSRVMICLNRKDMRNTNGEMLKLLAGQMADGSVVHPQRVLSKAIGSSKTKGAKNWIIDIDEHNVDTLAIVNLVGTMKPIGNKHVATIPTPNGCHIITRPFDKAQFKQAAEFVHDLHTGDSPTVLYVPTQIKESEV